MGFLVLTGFALVHPGGDLQPPGKTVQDGIERVILLKNMGPECVGAVRCHHRYHQSPGEGYATTYENSCQGWLGHRG